MSSFPDTPYQTQAPKPEVDDHGHGHHLSMWPIWLSFAIPVFLIGLVLFKTTPVPLFVGLVAIVLGLVGWTRDDIKDWPSGPNPLTWHTVGEKDILWWGILFFLGTEVVLFGSLFAVWFQAQSAFVANGMWAGAHEVEVLQHAYRTVAINTAILVASGFVMHYGEMALAKKNRNGFIAGFAGAIILGLIFLYNQVVEYQELIHEGMTFQSSILAGAFYMITGTHGLHVFVGVVLLTIVLIRGLLGQFNKERHSFITSAAYYWHFVDVVWIIVFLVIYTGPVYGWY